MDSIVLPAPWQERFTRERQRLLDALGALTDGGIVEALQPIGSLSFNVTAGNAEDSPEQGKVAGEATGKPQLRLDIGLAVWPFPLQARERMALEAIGYAPVPEYETAPEQRFQHGSAPFQLFVVEAGGEQWTDWLVLRDYLRAVYPSTRNHQPATAADSLVWRDTLRAGSEAQVDCATTLANARQWWMETKGFSPLEEVSRELAEFDGVWHIAGGWAIDCFLGRVTRVHHDIDILIARADQLAFQEYMRARNWKWVAPNEGKQEPWPSGVFLELPRHQAHAHRNAQMLDFLFGEISGGVWRFRRDPNILRTTERIFLRTASGLPCIAPEIALLYKSRAGSAGLRDRDQADFNNAHPHLNPEQRAWLRWALTATNAQHPWLPFLM